jgi:hypothetical protein
MSTQTEHIISFAVAVGIGAVLLLFGMKMVARIRLSFGTSLWTSFIACMLTSMISFGFGFVLANHMGLALLLAIVIGFFVQAVLFRVAVRATGQTLPAGKAYILSLVVILANFFVASPIVAWIVGNFSK